MNRKTIIQMLVIVICFGAAAFVLYNGFFKNNGGGSSSPDAGLAVNNQEATTFDPLPFGDDLSGELKRVLGRNGLQYEFFRYPTLDAGEVGTPMDNLIKPALKSQNAR